MKKLLLIVLVICSACNLEEQDTQDPIFCTDELRPGLEIKVKANSNNEITLTSGISVVVKDGSYTETLTNFPNTETFVGAFERIGTYSIMVSGDGYKTYTSDSPTTVDKDMCHVITESKEIILEPN